MLERVIRCRELSEHHRSPRYLHEESSTRARKLPFLCNRTRASRRIPARRMSIVVVRQLDGRSEPMSGDILIVAIILTNLEYLSAMFFSPDGEDVGGRRKKASE